MLITNLTVLYIINLIKLKHLKDLLTYQSLLTLILNKLIYLLENITLLKKGRNNKGYNYLIILPVLKF